MFGLSWAQLAIIAVVGAFVLGPERIPTAAAWAVTTLRKVRTSVTGAQAGLLRDLGPEIEELRRQIAELQSLTTMADLRTLPEDLDPRRWVDAPALGEAPTEQSSSSVAAAVAPVREPVVTSTVDQQAAPTATSSLTHEAGAPSSSHRVRTPGVG
jgi:Tat protein translocase TatB subunit